MTNEEYWYWFCSMEPLTDRVRKKILDSDMQPDELYEAGEAEITGRAGIPSELAAAVIRSRNKEKNKEDLNRLKDKGVRFLSIADGDFPDRLRNIPDFPLCLYIKGRIPENNVPSVGIVGARACSGYGQEYAGKAARRIAQCGIQTISGMALGIDSICAEVTLDAGGKTFAVLGSGIDVIYPRENIELYYAIITGGGGIISEYPPGTPPMAYNFPHRNRLIAGLSDRLLVIEAGKRSGTLSTAMHALDQGKDVWALPGRVNDRLSQGCNELIRDGAGMLIDIEEFLGSFSREINTAATDKISELPGMGTFSGTDKERILCVLGFEPAEIRTISENAGTDPVNTIEILSELEIEGLARRVSGSYYARK